MGIEYYKRPRSSGEASYTALGNEFTENATGIVRRPYAHVVVTHQPKQWAIPFANDQTIEPHTGLSHAYLDHVQRSLEKIDEGKWTGHDDDANQAINNINYGWHKRNEEDKEDLERQIDYSNHFSPQKLFYEGEPSSIIIDYMAADPSMKSTAMTLGAIAKRDLKADKIIASESLSPHSSKLVQKAIAKGLPVEAHEENPDAEITNDMDFEPRTYSNADIDYLKNYTNYKEVSPTVVKAARQDLSSMLRNPTPVVTPAPDIDDTYIPLVQPKETKTRNTRPVTRKGLSDQFVIPGMEGYV